MVTANNKKKTLLSAVASHIATQEYDEWPPKCATFLYQPKRPIALKSTEKPDVIRKQKV